MKTKLLILATFTLTMLASATKVHAGTAFRYGVCEGGARLNLLQDQPLRKSYSCTDEVTVTITENQPSEVSWRISANCVGVEEAPAFSRDGQTLIVTCSDPRGSMSVSVQEAQPPADDQGEGGGAEGFDASPGGGLTPPENLNIENNPIFERLNEIIQFLSIGVGIVSAISVAIAGLQYVSSRGEPSKTAAAINRLTQVGTAIFLYIFGWAILNWLIPGGTF
jgi:hypothetical protein